MSYGRFYAGDIESGLLDMNIGFSILTNEPVDIVYLTCTLDECIVDLFIECMA